MATMDKNIICNISHYEAPTSRMSDAVMERIKKRRLNILRLYVGIYLSLTLATVVAAFPTITYMGKSASESGLGAYFSLLISDGEYVLGHLKLYMLSISGSIPFLASITTMMVMIVLVLSIDKAIRSFRLLTNYHNNHYIKTA